VSQSRIAPLTNHGQTCEISGDHPRDHLQLCSCEQHTGFCQVCGYIITVGPDGTEYGHARRRDRDSQERDRGDCPHRPSTVDPSSTYG